MHTILLRYCHHDGWGGDCKSRIASRTNTSAQLHTSDLSASDNFWMSFNLHPAILRILSIYMIMEGTATRCTGFQYIASCNCSPLHSTSLRSIFKTNLPSSNQSWQWKTPLIYIYIIIYMCVCTEFRTTCPIKTSILNPKKHQKPEKSSSQVESLWHHTILEGSAIDLGRNRWDLGDDVQCIVQGVDPIPGIGDDRGLGAEKQ